jgi:hypothetical protein
VEDESRTDRRGQTACLQSRGSIYQNELSSDWPRYFAKTDSDALWNDFTMHMRVFSEFNSLRWISSEVHVPRCHWFASVNDDEWWSDNLEKFPKIYQSRNNVLCSERILPLPKVTRETLIDKYCPVNLRTEVKSDPSNRDCLVRLYFGKRRERPSRFFTLRNFLLHVD